jgi:hypothetical protein
MKRLMPSTPLAAPSRPWRQVGAGETGTSAIDRQRHTVKLAADICDNRCFQISDDEMSAACDFALHEQLRSGEFLHSRRCQSWTIRRTCKRIQAIHVLPLDAKRLALSQGCGLAVRLPRCLPSARRSRFYKMPNRI